MAEPLPLLPRSLTAAVQTALADTPVVCIAGARQSGKTTLVRGLEPDRPFYTLDEGRYHHTAQLDPDGFIAGLPEFVTIDEVQRVPDLLRAIKLSVDRNRRPGRFLLTGSANILTVPTVSESLAGRMEIVVLHPLTEAEKERRPGKFLATLLAGDLGARNQRLVSGFRFARGTPPRGRISGTAQPLPGAHPAVAPPLSGPASAARCARSEPGSPCRRPGAAPATPRGAHGQRSST